MNEEGACPLCGEKAVSTLESIAGADLEHLLQKLIRGAVPRAIDGHAIIAHRRCANCELEWFDPSVPASGEVYKALQREDWYYMDDKPEYRTALPYIHADQSVLEVGCGRGAFALLAKPATYVGLEFSPEAKAMATQAGLDVRATPIEEFAEAHPASFDAAVTFQVLEHVEKPAEFLCATVKALRPSGLLILSVPNNDSHLADMQNGTLNLPPHHQTRWTKRTLEKAAERAGCRLVAIHEERLWKQHEQGYLATVIDLAICQRLGWRRPAVDLSFAAGVRRKCAMLLARLVRPGLEMIRGRPPGQSITAIMQRAS